VRSERKFAAGTFGNSQSLFERERLFIGFPQRRVPPTDAAFFTISVLFVGQDASVSEPIALLF
jgi:hypothetical protein